jgi:signal transduction histidine kinase
VVADNGEGFDPAYHRTLFHRFGGGRNGQPHGSGLGLALVQEIVQSHGGTVTAAGRPGAGADFTVRLPAAPVARSREATADPALAARRYSVDRLARGHKS